MTAAEGPAGTARVPAGPFVHRETVRTATGAVHVAWTSVAAGNLALHVVPPDEAEGLARVSAARRALERVMGVPEGATLYLDQVHSADVVWADGPGRGGAPAPVADAAVSRDGSRPLAVMVADCLPVVVVDETTGATAVAHAGRRGLLDGVLEATVDRLLSLRPETDRTGPGLRAWIGPGVCGRCYEVPAAMRADAAARLPATAATTSWGTPALDLPAGAAEVLRARGVAAATIDVCTREDERLFSHRRAPGEGRFAGLVWRADPDATTPRGDA